MFETKAKCFLVQPSYFIGEECKAWRDEFICLIAHGTLVVSGSLSVSRRNSQGEFLSVTLVVIFLFVDMLPTKHTSLNNVHPFVEMKNTINCNDISLVCLNLWENTVFFWFLKNIIMTSR